jgi:hypothetical protein
MQIGDFKLNENTNRMEGNREPFASVSKNSQRWELVGLSLHRPKSVGRVVAFPEELDAWMEVSPMRADRIGELQAKVERLD